MSTAPTAEPGTLDTVKVTAPSYGKVLLNSVVTHIQLLDPWDDDSQWEGNGVFNPRAPTRTERLQAQLQEQGKDHQSAIIIGSVIVTVGTVLLFPEGAEEEVAGREAIEDEFQLRGPTLEQATKRVHGNNLNTTTPAQGYTLRDRNTGEILKYGETTRGYARYSKRYLRENNAIMFFEAKGTKKEMHAWQHERILEYKANNQGNRPRLNRSDY